MQYLCHDDPVSVAPAALRNREDRVAYWARLSVSVPVINQHLKQMDYERELARLRHAASRTLVDTKTARRLRSARR